MIYYELKPTFENLKNSILDDTVGRNESIADFIKLLDAIDGNISIALNANWGDGKTFFVKQTQMVLQSYQEGNNKLVEVKTYMEQYFSNYQIKNYLPVYYDAWSNDNDDDPILSIIFTMLQNIADLNGYEVNDRKGLDILTNGLETLSTSFGGPRIKQFLDSIIGENILKEIKKIKDIEQILNEIFEVLLNKQPDETRIIFFIDELDRCCPNYAVKLIERIKHYFVNDRVMFVFSINEFELQHTIKRHYGNDFNADKYLHRFFDFNLPLPSANIKNFYTLVNLDTAYRFLRTAEVMIRKYNFSLREIIRYVQNLKCAFPPNINNFRQYEHAFYVNTIIPFLIGLKIHDLNKFNEFINGENINYFLEIMNNELTDCYCGILLDETKETFENNKKNGKTPVSLLERFDPIYKCLFGKRGEDTSRYVRIFNYTFQADDLNFIMEIIGLKYANRNLAGEKNAPN